jgi:hypothetical protein
MLLCVILLLLRMIGLLLRMIGLLLLLSLMDALDVLDVLMYVTLTRESLLWPVNGCGNIKRCSDGIKTQT